MASHTLPPAKHRQRARGASVGPCSRTAQRTPGLIVLKFRDLGITSSQMLTMTFKAGILFVYCWTVLESKPQMNQQYILSHLGAMRDEKFKGSRICHLIIFHFGIRIFLSWRHLRSSIYRKSSLLSSCLKAVHAFVKMSSFPFLPFRQKLITRDTAGLLAARIPHRGKLCNRPC